MTAKENEIDDNCIMLAFNKLQETSPDTPFIHFEDFLSSDLKCVSRINFNRICRGNRDELMHEIGKDRIVIGVIAFPSVDLLSCLGIKNGL